MPLRFEDIKTLIDWLGPEGAKAGLEFCHLSVTELRSMAESQGVRIASKARRNDIVENLMFVADQRIHKTMDELFSMSSNELMDYFEAARPSRTELLRLLEKLDFHPGSEAQRGLYKYAARQIGETGMFKRVAESKSKTG